MKGSFARILSSVLLGAVVAASAVGSTESASAVTAPSPMPAPPDSTPTTEGDPETADAFQGEVVICGEEVVGVGKGRMEVTLELPEGYELSEYAPLYVSLFSEDSQVVRAEVDPPEWTFETPRFPLELPVRFATGQTGVRVDVGVYYCESARKQLCQMSEVRALVPVSVSPCVSLHVIRLDIPVPVSAP